MSAVLSKRLEVFVNTDSGLTVKAFDEIFLNAADVRYIALTYHSFQRNVAFATGFIRRRIGK